MAAFLPVCIFLFFCILYFIVLKAFEMYALAMGAFVALLISAVFTKKGHYDLGSRLDGGKPLLTARERGHSGYSCLIIGMFSAMGCQYFPPAFVWLADKLHVGGGLFTAFTFFAVCIIASATGSSLGTMFTCFPIFYAAGILLGSNPSALASAIVSGGIFGDNLAPISDTTIISAGTQEYTKKSGFADVGGCVTSRLKYSLAAGAVSFVLFWIFGGGGTLGSGAEEILTQNMNPATLVMLVPVVVMLVTAVKTRNIYKAITVGLILGTIVDWLPPSAPSSILSVKDGAPAGFLTDGINGMIATITLVLSVYGIMGVLTAAGALEKITNMILDSKFGQTTRGADCHDAWDLHHNHVLRRRDQRLHGYLRKDPERDWERRPAPYRRANLLDGFANSIVLAVPFLSVFVFIGSSLTAGYEYADALSVTQVSGFMFYCFSLFLVLLFSVITGWGRAYEGAYGKPVRTLENRNKRFKKKRFLRV